MEDNFLVHRTINVALLGENYYARVGIRLLLEMQSSNVGVKIIASTNDSCYIKQVLKECKMDFIFILDHGIDKNLLDFIKKYYPNIVVCLSSARATSFHWVIGSVDKFFSLKESIGGWFGYIGTLVNTPVHLIKITPHSLSLSTVEWRVLKYLRGGMRLHQIAFKEKLNYRRVSALKSSATIKLGLKNKADLLIFLSS